MAVVKLRPNGRSTSLRFFVVALLVIATLYIHLPRPILEGNISDLGRRSIQDPCASFAGLDRVVITVKTGATEALEKIPIQLRTSLRCAPHVYVFSDMAQKVGNVQIFDALDRIPAEVKDGNTDFDIYRKQQEMSSPERIANELRDLKDPRYPTKLAAWTLDKYKNIHIVEKAWAHKPDMDWYFHIDADTYVVWSSLMTWLQRLEPSNELFLGSLSYAAGKPFAHGGSGILLSNAATRKLVVANNGTAARWNSEIRKHCCGDWVLAQSLKEYGIGMKNSWPTINGESADTIPFASDHWCQPLVTTHHMSPSDMERVANFERERHNKSSPVTYAEMYKDLISDTVPGSLEDWDNGSKVLESVDIISAEGCVQACANNPSCFQTLFNGTRCMIETKKFRLGEKRLPRVDARWQSSWNKTRIEAWVADQAPCDKITFPFQEKLPGA